MQALKRVLKKQAKNFLQAAGVPVGQHSLYPIETANALQRLSKNTTVQTVVDIGASNGIWSVNAKQYFPEAFYHLIDANSCHQQELDALVKREEKFSYKIAAAGDEAGTIFFDARESLGGLAMKEKDPTIPCIEVPVVTIDDEVERLKLTGPFLIKLDTHGFEVPILLGAEKTLSQASLVVIETYNFRLTQNSLLFHEMCAWMEEKGFRVADISEPLWRKKDGFMWQIDLFFIKTDRSEFKDNTY